MKKSRRDIDFIDLPKLSGGKKAFREYIAKNLQYPEEALKNRIEGDVLVEVEVNDLGKVIQVKVINGPGYGCEEEAVRLIKNMRFEKTRKQRVRVKSNFKTKINFKLPASKLSYNYNNVEKQSDTSEKSKVTYTYNIRKK